MLLLGDCLDVLPHWPDDTFDIVCTDPPYGLGFMGKHWDHGVPGVEYWRQVLRVAKPGAYLTAFGGTRTFHRLVCAIEDAGWEVRDCLMWLYGTGFPKSLNVGKALDKAAGAEREVIGQRQGILVPTGALDGWDRPWMHDEEARARRLQVTAPATELAKLYDGYGTALKPSYEPVILARKPLVGTVAQNVQQYGTGGLNIDASRVEPGVQVAGGGNNFDAWHSGESRDDRPPAHGVSSNGHANGRWPPNVLLGHAADCNSETCDETCPCSMLPKTSGTGIESHTAETSVARFFSRLYYDAKTSRKERAGSTHPTVKPLAVVEWLLRLTAPPGRPVVLDPFVGSGTTLIAAERLGIDSVGVEREPEYVEQAYRRVRSLP